MFVKRTLENKTTAGINYKELYDCIWDGLALENNTLCTPAFIFSNNIGLMMACTGRN